MTDYNDGKWHGWNGGECPVHPESIVSILLDEGRRSDRLAMLVRWSWENSSSDVRAFLVVKAHREPREWWLRLDAVGGVCGSDPALGAPPPNWDDARTIRVREVLP